MSTGLLYHGWGVRGYRHLKTSFEKGVIRLYVEPASDTRRCSSCGSWEVIKAGQVPRRFRTLPIGNKPVWIE
jgi:hypothetical protein